MKKQHLALFIILLIATLTRLAFLSKYPAGLNADEAAIGYNAYSLLQTGKDEHGASWPLVFRSFDDYKPPLYFYLVLPFVKFFGLNIWSVRLPSALLGVASVYLIFLLANQLFQKEIQPSTKTANKKSYLNKAKLGLLASLLLALSPWHIQFSRGGWETNTATFFILLGTYLFFKALTKPSYYLWFVTSYLLSLYTYHSARIIAPLLGLSLVIIFRQNIFSSSKHFKTLFISGLLALIISLPVLNQMFSKEGQSRFSGVSVFADQGPLWQALELRRNYQGSELIGRLLYNRYDFYALRIAKNYISHFSPQFLFISGDEIARNKVPDLGQSYLFLLPFFYFGLFYLTKQIKKKNSQLILSWLFISPLAASLTFQSPHALRAHSMVIPFTIITAIGIYLLKNLFVRLWSLVFVSLLTILFVYSSADYLYKYYIRYPKELGFAWEYGFDQVAEYVKDNENKYTQIIISDRYDQPYIIMAFFLKYPPKKLQNEIVLTPRDKFGFSTVKKFGKFKFKKIDFLQDNQQKNSLIITTTEKVNNSKFKPIYQVFFPNGQPAFKFYDSNVTQKQHFL